MTERESFKCDSFVFYGSFYEAIRELPPDNQVNIYNAVFNYAFNGNELELKGIEKAIFLLIKPQLDANRVKYENGCKGGEYGNRGGAPVGNQNARKKQPQNNGDIDFETNETTPKQPQNNPKTTPNDNANVNDNYKDIKEKGTHSCTPKEKELPHDSLPYFEPPTIEEVKSFVKARELEHVDAERFYNWYSARNWYSGRTKIVYWQSEALNWERREIERLKNVTEPLTSTKKSASTGNMFLDLAKEEGIL